MQTRLQGENCSFLDFCLYFEATGPICFNVFFKIRLQSIFSSRIINKNKNKSKNSKISRTNSEATLQYSGAILKHSECHESFTSHYAKVINAP